MPRFQLTFDTGRYVLKDCLGRQKPLLIDFQNPGTLRRLFKGGKKEMLHKAVGSKPGLKVWDCTAGLGTDALLLAYAGCHVRLFERSPVLHLLLEQALATSARHVDLAETIGRMQLVKGSADHYFRYERLPDVLYLDPMFPAKKKSARVNGSMQYLQRFIGPERDAPLLIQAALNSACERIVVKLSAQQSEVAKPSFSLAAKANRFDVFVR